MVTQGLIKFFRGNPDIYSAETLKILYADLLQRIDATDARQRATDLPPPQTRRFLFFKSVLQNETDESERAIQRKKDLIAAFRLLSATRSADKEGGSYPGTALVFRETLPQQAMSLARSLEASVIGIIRSIGELIVNCRSRKASSLSSLRDDEAFEFFGEKAMLNLFVSIVQAKPGGYQHKSFHGVVWTPAVKAQVIQTVALMISAVRDESALYLMLSQNCVNQLIATILPLTQWTDPALETMLPAYVELLKSLTIQLAGLPHVYSFLTVQENSTVYFPLFSATLDMATSPYAQSHLATHKTCLSLLVDILHIVNEDLQSWVASAEPEQAHLAKHFCDMFLTRYRRIVDLTTGLVVDGVRSNALSGQLMHLEELISSLNEIFWCDQRSLNVRLCDRFLSTVVRQLLQNLTIEERDFLCVGETDRDVIPDREAMAQVSTVFFSRLFSRLEYPPLVRMLVVALFHAHSTELWRDNSFKSSFTPILNKIVKGELQFMIDNPYRLQLIKTLRGDYGEWRFVASVTLLESAIKSPALDSATLALLNILPENHSDTTVYDAALVRFLDRSHVRRSSVTVMALERCSMVALWLLHKEILFLSGDGTQKSMMIEMLNASVLWKTLKSTRDYFFNKTISSQNVMGVSEIFVDLIESSILSRYRRMTTTNGNRTTKSTVFAYPLSQDRSHAYGTNAEILIRKMRSVSLNEVEATRFNAEAAIHFRAICRVFDRFCQQIYEQSACDTSRNALKRFELNTTDEAGILTEIFPSLLVKPQVGTDLDLRGRMTFRFSTDLAVGINGTSTTNFSEDSLFSSTVPMVLVLDPTDLFIVRLRSGDEIQRGVVVCCIPLLNIIAAAGDGVWIHIAVRHDDVDGLIKNGNMALKFDTAGTCLIVAQYLERSRKLLRKESSEKIRLLFSVEDAIT